MVSTGRGERSSLGLSGELPSADELAAEVERFLADQDDDGKGGKDGKDNPGGPQAG
jgi:hypothetical protein